MMLRPDSRLDRGHLTETRETAKLETDICKRTEVIVIKMVSHS